MAAPLRLTPAQAKALAGHLQESTRAAKGSEVGKLIAALSSGKGVEITDDPR